MKIVVCQFYTSNISYGKYSESINQKYCEDNGYEYFVEKNGDKIKTKIGSRSWTWYKPHLIEEVFLTHPNCDYILFMDIDAIFCNNSRKIEEFITDDFSILMTEDYGPSLVNAGVMLLKNDEFSKKFIRDWWDICEEFPQYKEGLWHDQTCIGLLHNKLNSPKEFKIINNFDFNARAYNKDRFIFHAFSYGASPNRSIDIIFREKFSPIETSDKKKIKAIVYHIYCVGDYKEIVKSQVKRLRESGLYDWCDIMEVTCVDTKENFEGIDQIFDGMGKINVFKTNRNSFEYWGIKKVWDLSQTNDGQVFYFHSKGVSNTYTNLKTNEINDWKVSGISYWREMLEYFLIDNFNECLKTLDSKDNCGVTCNGGWFWGNFWWSNLSFIRNNSEPVFGDRWYFEAWLNQGRDHNSHEFFKFNFNPYFTQLPVEIYKNNNLINGKPITIESSYYGTIGIQLNEGYPDDTPLLQIDVTEKVKQHFKNNEILINVDNSIFGDPAYKHKKFLLINILIEGKPYKVVFDEGVLGKLTF
jgi:hypothetical protein